MSALANEIVIEIEMPKLERCGACGHPTWIHYTLTGFIGKTKVTTVNQCWEIAEHHGTSVTYCGCRHAEDEIRDT